MSPWLFQHCLNNCLWSIWYVSLCSLFLLSNSSKSIYLYIHTKYYIIYYIIYLRCFSHMLACLLLNMLKIQVCFTETIYDWFILTGWYLLNSISIIYFSSFNMYYFFLRKLHILVKLVILKLSVLFFGCLIPEFLKLCYSFYFIKLKASLKSHL